MRIYRRGKTWCVDYSYKGKCFRRAAGRSWKTAELTLKDIEIRIAKGENLGIHEQRRVLLKDYAIEYLEYSRANKDEQSARRDGVSLKHLVASFGDQYLFTTTPNQIERYKEYRLENGGVKPATINREIACLSNMFTKAVEWGYASQSPAKGVRLFKEPPGRLRYLQPEEMTALLNQCSPHLRSIVLTALHTGMRLSEILNLRWSSVNLKMQSITVENSKNNERRIIPTNPTLYQELKKLSLHKRSDFVYSTQTGLPYTNIRKGFVAACKRAGIRDFRFHDLRHTFASRLVMSGASLRAVQQLLGHREISMTMRYWHLSRQHLQEAVGMLCLSLTGEMQKQDAVMESQITCRSKKLSSMERQKT